MVINCLHSHLLPGIDDGVRTIEESITSLAKARHDGVLSMVLTPHYIVHSKFSSNYSNNLELFKTVTSCIENLGIDIKLYLGNEVYFDEDIVNLLKKKVVSTLNGSRYVLIEFPLNSIVRSYENVFCDLREEGYVPVIAHPERYKHDYNYDDILLQGNYMSLFGKYGNKAKKKLEKLLLEGRITCLGSDVHDNVTDFEIKKLYKRLKELGLSEEYISSICISNFDKIINNIEM